MQARTLRHGLAQLCAIALMLPVSPAMADPIRITGGYFSVGAPFGVDLLFYTGGTGPDAGAYGLDDLRWFTVNAMKSAFLPFDERLVLINDVIKPAYAAL